MRLAWSSRLREPPPQPLTEPYVKLSLHTALHVPHKVPSLRKSPAPPIAGWPAIYFGHVSPFAPFPLQKPHHYYELIRPCALHRYSNFVGSPHQLLPLHQDDRFSCSAPKPVLNSCHLHADCHFARAQITSKLIPEIRSVPGFDSVYTYRHLINGSFAFISSELTWQIASAFSLSLTTRTLYASRIGWFDSSIWLPKPRDLPSSLIQQERLSSFFMTHKRSVAKFPHERFVRFEYLFTVAYRLNLLDNNQDK